MQSQIVNASTSGASALVLEAFLNPKTQLWAGPNDGGIKRGDREETGNDAADLDEIGTGPAQTTVDPTSLGENPSVEQPGSSGLDSGDQIRDTDGIEVMQADDGRLGLTGLAEAPAQDWAADTGDTKNPF